MNWKKFKEEKPPEGEEVLAYHPSWIWDYQDCYITISHCDCDDNSLFSDRIKTA